MNIFDSIADAARRNPWIAFGAAIILYLLGASAMVGTLAQIMFSMMGLSPADISAIATGTYPMTPSLRNGTMLLQAAHQIFSFGLPAYIMARALHYSSDRWGLTMGNSPSVWGIAIMIMLVALPLVNFVNFDPELTYLPESFQQLEESLRKSELLSRERLRDYIETSDPTRLIINLVIFALIPGVCEELFFRGIIQQSLQKIFQPVLAIVLTAAIFSFIHYQFYGFLGRTIMGIFLGYFFYRTKSLFPSILAHFAFNATSIVAVYLMTLQPESQNNDLDLPTMAWYVYLGIGVFLVGLIVLFIRLTPPPIKEEREATKDE
ncbi:MAG: CPBP family intramembrane glutamic endopeptidase [Bacteroidota bacterium]